MQLFFLESLTGTLESRSRKEGVEW